MTATSGADRRAARLRANGDDVTVTFHPATPASGAGQPTLRDRYAQCDGTCTVDCGACKGQGRPSVTRAAVTPGDDQCSPVRVSAATRAVIGGVTFTVAAVVAELVWGGRGVDVVLVATILWLLYARAVQEDRLEDARAETDEAREGVDDIKAHLTGNERPGKGRHSDGQPPSYRSATIGPRPPGSPP